MECKQFSAVSEQRAGELLKGVGKLYFSRNCNFCCSIQIPSCSYIVFCLWLELLFIIYTFSFWKITEICVSRLCLLPLFFRAFSNVDVSREKRRKLFEGGYISACSTSLHGGGWKRSIALHCFLQMYIRNYCCYLTEQLVASFFKQTILLSLEWLLCCWHCPPVVIQALLSGFWWSWGVVVVFFVAVVWLFFCCYLFVCF